MTLPGDKEKFNEWAKGVVESSGRKIMESEVFCAILHGDFLNFLNNPIGPKFALEIGLAVLMDKPIVVVAPVGTRISKCLLKIADRIEFFKGPDDIGLATERALKSLDKAKGGLNDD